MGDYIRGLVVRLHVTPKLDVAFKKNYGCTRKTYNVILSKCRDKYGDTFTKVPSKNELNKFLMEAKEEFPYLRDTESTSLQQSRDDLHKAFENTFKSKKHKSPKFHSKKRNQTQLQTNHTQRKKTSKKATH